MTSRSDRYVLQTRKPIPTKVDRWRAEVKGILRYLNAPCSPGEGKEGQWYARQREYYLTRLDDLTHRVPLPLRQTAELRATLREVKACRSPAKS